eukprot:4912910-Prymnesium_polylepis.1
MSCTKCGHTHIARMGGDRAGYGAEGADGPAPQGLVHVDHPRLHRRRQHAVSLSKYQYGTTSPVPNRVT